MYDFIYIQISEIGDNEVTKPEIMKYFEEKVIPHINGENEEDKVFAQHTRCEIENFISSVIDSLNNKKISKVCK